MSVLKRLTSQFYATGGAIGLKSDAIDEAIGAGARASFATNTVTITYPDGRETFHIAPPGVRAKAVKFVNQFNDRAGQ